MPRRGPLLAQLGSIGRRLPGARARMVALYPDTGFGRTFSLGIMATEILVAMARPGGAIDILGVGSTGGAVRLGHDISPFCHHRPS